jgi:O-antigen biosynthesis protein
VVGGRRWRHRWSGGDNDPLIRSASLAACPARDGTVASLRPGAAILEDHTHRPVNLPPPAAGARPLLCLYRRRAQDDLAAARARLPAGVDALVVAADATAADGAVLAPGAGSDPALAALRAAAAACPGRDVLLLDAAVQLPALALERLQLAMQALPAAEVWSPLGAGVAAHLPAGIDPALDAAMLDRWCWLLSDRALPRSHAWSPHCSLWRAGALAALADGPPPATLRLHLCDLLHVAAETVADGAPLPAVAALGARLGGRRGLPAAPGLGDRPVLLHVLHGWGGGAERFVRDLIAGDRRFEHLVLCARGDPASGRHGERLELHVDLDAAPIRRWTLPTPILATALDDGAVQAVLARIGADFGVAAVLVSSLIGHSLDVLRTGLPTAVVCHDYYPLWPRLHADFGDAAIDRSPAAIPAALAGTAAFEFGERRPDYWQALRAAYVAALEAGRVRMVAPGRGVRANQCRIEPALLDRPWRLIEHGLADWPAPPAAAPPAASGRALRILVPGRLRAGKGEQLLAGVIPELPEGVELVLLGAGAAGMRFFGCRGVHLRLDYRREQLPALVAELAPDAALLPSTVAETYSYLLSELRSLGVPVIATRLGSFAERIEHGVDGLLVDPEPAAVRALLRALVTDRTPLQRLQPAARPPTLEAMAAGYAELLGDAAARAPLPLAPDPLGADAHTLEVRLAAAVDALERLRARLARQQSELDQRAEWAQSQQALAEQRTRWARSLEADLDASRRHATDLQALVDERTAWALGMQAEHAAAIEAWQARHAAALEAAERDLAELVRQRDHFEAERNRMLASSSWRLTAPLRWSRRQFGAWLASLRFRLGRLRALARRGRTSLRSRGLRGTLARLRREWQPPTPPARFELPPEAASAMSIDGLALPCAEQPRASIVVPAYNHLEHSLTCLRALAAQPQRSGFEVILVDDCSQDATASLLPQVPGLRYLRNADNLGFIGACNAGAAAARGEYLVFLNNDTAVQPGWLDALLDTFDQHPGCGLAGAKLVYPDGRLQEAGGIVFADGSGWNYGRFEDPADPRFNFVREADYCSGAAIALPRALFERLGGFDSHYAPAYYEDTDLAMRVRAAGLRVLYQPASVVVHFEGVSSGTDTASGVKAYQVVNQRKFVERWREVLASHPAPGTDIARARQHRCRREALVIDATTPTPDQDSGSVRLVNLLRLLREDGCAVTFFADNRAFVERYTPALQQLGVEVLWHPWLADPVGWFAEHGRRFDLVLVSRHYVACNYLGLVRTHAPQARFVFDTVDLHYLREQRAAELAGDDELQRIAADTRRRELALVREADVTLVVSPVEQQLLARDAPGARVDVLSNVHQLFGCRRGFTERADLLFVGGFQHPPNIDAARWLVEAILPRVRAELPQLRLHLVGSRAPASVRALGDCEGVVFHGFVEELEPLLDGIRIAVAPLRYGAGVKGKINMSMSYGQPVVATSMAVEGMYLNPGEDVLVADEPEAFAAAVIRLYRDEALWTRLSRNGLANIERHFSFAAAREAVQRLYPRG